MMAATSTLRFWGSGSFENDAAMRWVEGLEDEDDLEMVVPAVHRILKSHQGGLPVFFDYRKTGLGSVTIQAGDDFRVSCTQDLLTELEKVLGVERIRLN